MNIFKKDHTALKKEQKNLHQLTDVTRGLHHAASSTSALLAEHYIKLLGQYFDIDENGNYEAKTVSIKLVDDKVVVVPLISLVAPKGLTLEKMNVGFSVRMREADVKAATDKLDGANLTRSSFKVELSPNSSNSSKRSSSVVDIDVEFAAQEPPEGIMRLIDQYASLVSPFKETQQPSPFSKGSASARLAIINSALSNAEIMTELNKYNYTEEKLEEGKSMCIHVKKLDEINLEIEAKVNKTKDELQEVYQTTYEIAKIALREFEAGNKLESIKPTEKNLNKWLEHARLFYKIVLSTREIMLEMGKFNYSKDKLLGEQNMVSGISDLLNEVELNADNEETKKLNRWMKDFRNITRIALKQKPLLLNMLLFDTDTAE